MRRFPINKFEDKPYDITGREGGGGTSLYSLYYFPPVFVVVLVIIVVINFIIKNIENRHVKVESNSCDAALHVIIGGNIAYVYQRLGIDPGQSRSLEKGISGTVDKHLRR